MGKYTIRFQSAVDIRLKYSLEFGLKSITFKVDGKLDNGLNEH